MTRRNSVVIVGALVAAIGVSLAAFVVQRGADSSTTRATLEDFEIVVEASGKLEAAVAFEVGPPSVRDFWQYDLAWMIPEGTVVEQGEVVARFDSTDLDERLRDHKASLETVLQEKEKEKRNLDVELRQLRLDLVKAEGELKTLEVDLAVPEELLASIEVERLRLRRKLAGQRVAFLTEKIAFEKELVKAQLDLLDVKREFEEGKIATIEASKEKFQVKAPVAGLVIYISKRNGDRWEVGEAVWMMAKVLQVADITTLQVEANLLEIDASRISPGQPAEISVDAIPGLTLTSTVRDVGEIVHERSLQDRSKVFDAILPVDGLDHEAIRPGMGVHVKIRTELLADRVTVPTEAVRATADGTWVEIVRSDGVERRRVTLGPQNSGRVVVDAGLEAGDVVRLFEERS